MLEVYRMALSPENQRRLDAYNAARKAGKLGGQKNARKWKWRKKKKRPTDLVESLLMDCDAAGDRN